LASCVTVRLVPRLSSLLNVRLSLFEISDVEAFCASIILDRLREWRAHLSSDQYEDLLTFTIESVWELTLRYDPERAPSFSAYAGHIAKLRIADWYRRPRLRTTDPGGSPLFGRSVAKRNAVVVSLDQELTDSDANSGDFKPHRLADRLEDASASPEDRALAGCWALDR
jgi:DNA-directed RNA polymerase specialized sigma24 family protein